MMRESGQLSKIFSQNKGKANPLPYILAVASIALIGFVGGRFWPRVAEVEQPASSQAEKKAKPLPAKSEKTSKQSVVQAAVLPQSQPAIATQTITYGRSVKGRPLTAYIMGNGPDTTMIFGAFHGNEPATPGVVRKLHDYLKRHPEMLEGRRVVLSPVVNPDGLSRGTRVNARGVDLNRNFSYGWKSTSKGANYFPGKKPESEPETRAVIALMQQYSPQKVVSIHQPYHTMNYTGEAGRQLALAMRKHNNYPITPDIGYPTPGSYGDYCGKKLGIGIVTLELPTQSSSAAWEANRDALLAAIKQR
jgi:protein MpaA